MVTFSSNESADSLNKKFRIPKQDKDKVILSREEYENHTEETHTCGTCGGELDYSKIDDSYWCNNCVIYVDVKNVKRNVSYDLPQSTENIVPDIVSVDLIGIRKLR
jgi:ssDNA-binding Zn-finger/Zn-ribbon topoisomerase 1